MPLAPALRGQLIRAKPDIRLVGDHGVTEEMHSILLMTLSPYFQIVLNNGGSGLSLKNPRFPKQSERSSLDKQEMKTVRIDGANREILKLIKEYAYEGKIPSLSTDNVWQVHKVADMYNIIGILNECQLFVDKHKLDID